MADFNGHLSVEGLDTVLKGLEKADKAVQQAAFRGLQKGAMEIINEAKRNLRDNMSVVTGLLRASGKVQKTGELSLDAGFFDTQNKGSGYAFYVEYGRRAGKMPPIYILKQWFVKKYGVEERIAWAYATNMAKRVAQEGTKPHPFFGPAVEKCKTKILNHVRDEIRRATSKDSL